MVFNKTSDLLRSLSGQWVFNIREPVQSANHGVYKLYCIMDRGLYKNFGNKINRTSYKLPIYIGKWHSTDDSNALNSLTVTEQLKVWRTLMADSKDVDQKKMFCQMIGLDNQSDANALYRAATRKFKPLWNVCIDGRKTRQQLECAWRELNSENTVLRNSLLKSLDELFEKQRADG